MTNINGTISRFSFFSLSFLLITACMSFNKVPINTLERPILSRRLHRKKIYSTRIAFNDPKQYKSHTLVHSNWKLIVIFLLGFLFLFLWIHLNFIVQTVHTLQSPTTTITACRYDASFWLVEYKVFYIIKFYFVKMSKLPILSFFNAICCRAMPRTTVALRYARNFTVWRRKNLYLKFQQRTKRE